MTKGRFFLGAALVVALFAGNCAASADVVHVRQDSFVHEQDTVNHGARTTMVIKRDDNHDRIAFLEFDLSAYAGQTISTASLSVVMDSVTAIGSMAAYDGAAMTLDVHGLSPAAYGNSWSEFTITGNSRPGRSSRASTTNNINFTEGSLWMPPGSVWNEQSPAPLGSVRVTLGGNTALNLYEDSQALLDFLNMAKAHNGGLVTLVLWTSTEHDDIWLSIASKEHATLQGPRLLINEQAVSDLQIEITSPAADALIEEGEAFTVAVEISGQTETMGADNVSFYVNGVLLGFDASLPYEITVSDLDPGIHALTAVVEDSLGKTATSAAVSIRVSRLSGGERVSRLLALQDTYVHEQDTANFGTAPVVIVKRDDNHDRVTYLEFDLFDLRNRAILEAKLSVVIDAITREATNLSDGDTMRLDLYALSPAAYAGGWSERLITGANHPARLAGTTSNNVMLDHRKLWKSGGTDEMPTPLASQQIVLPAQGETLALDLFVNDATLLEFLNTAKFTNDGKVTLILWTGTQADDTWVGFASGNHPTLAGPELVLDSGERSNVTVQLVSPIQGSFIAATERSIQIEAAVVPVDGAGIAHVDFYIDGAFEGRSTRAPYSVTADGVAGGVHHIYAVAVDTQGRVASSPPVSIEVEAHVNVSIAVEDGIGGEYGDRSLAFSINRDGGLEQALTVFYSISGTADNGIDYEHLSGVATFDPLERTVTVGVTVLPDDISEGEESLMLTILATEEYFVGRTPSATVYIADAPAQAALYALFGNSALAAPYADADGDGVSNIAEYYMGTDPADASSNAAMSVSWENGFRLHLPQVAKHSDVIPQFFWSTDMENWFENGQSNGEHTLWVREHTDWAGSNAQGKLTLAAVGNTHFEASFEKIFFKVMFVPVSDAASMMSPELRRLAGILEVIDRDRLLTTMRNPSLVIPERTNVQVPFPMPEIAEPEFPDYTVSIIDFGAIEGYTANDSEAAERQKTQANIQAIRAAIDHVAQAGGGTVLIPEGMWRTGAIHLKSNIHLRIEGRVSFTTVATLENYPAVLTRWQGIDCYNISPFIYARDCENIAITGNGELIGNGSAWHGWRNNQFDQWKRLGDKMIEDWNLIQQGVISEARMELRREEHNTRFRPVMIQPYNCKNVLISGLKITTGPFWTVHLVYCENLIIRGLSIYTRGINTDGINPDSCKNVLIERNYLDCGNDCFTIKSGLNQDGWRVNRPTENIVIRYNIIRGGFGGVVIGSEISGGVRNLFSHDNIFHGTQRGFRYKSRLGRGGSIENIYAENTVMTGVTGEAIHLNPLYATASSTLSDESLNRTPSEFKGIFFKDIFCRSSTLGIDLDGYAPLPINGVRMENMFIESSGRTFRQRNTTNIELGNVWINGRLIDSDLE